MGIELFFMAFFSYVITIPIAIILGFVLPIIEEELMHISITYIFAFCFWFIAFIFSTGDKISSFSQILVFLILIPPILTYELIRKNKYEESKVKIKYKKEVVFVGCFVSLYLATEVDFAIHLIIVIIIFDFITEARKCLNKN